MTGDEKLELARLETLPFIKNELCDSYAQSTTRINIAGNAAMLNQGVGACFETHVGSSPNPPQANYDTIP